LKNTFENLQFNDSIIYRYFKVLTQKINDIIFEIISDPAKFSIYQDNLKTIVNILQPCLKDIQILIENNEDTNRQETQNTLEKFEDKEELAQFLYIASQSEDELANLLSINYLLLTQKVKEFNIIDLITQIKLSSSSLFNFAISLNKCSDPFIVYQYFKSKINDIFVYLKQLDSIFPKCQGMNLSICQSAQNKVKQIIKSILNGFYSIAEHPYKYNCYTGSIDNIKLIVEDLSQIHNDLIELQEAHNLTETSSFSILIS
jgi:hypothetical protein